MSMMFSGEKSSSLRMTIISKQHRLRRRTIHDDKRTNRIIMLYLSFIEKKFKENRLTNDQ